MLDRQGRVSLLVSKERVGLKRKIDRAQAKIINGRLALMRERGFEVVDVPGQVTVELRKMSRTAHGEDEEIRVEFETQKLSDEDDTLRIFDVIITRARNKEHYLVLSCTFYPQFRQLSVRNVKCNDVPTSPHVYDGPHLYSLRQNTQDAIVKYLAERGIDEKMAEFIRYYIVHKRAQEVVYALDGLAELLKKS